MPAQPKRPPTDHPPKDGDAPVDTDPDEAVGDFGDEEQSDAGGDSDPR